MHLPNLRALALTAALTLGATSIAVSVSAPVAYAQEAKKAEDSSSDKISKEGLEALGASSSMQLYSTANYLGGLADGYRSGVYKKMEVMMRLGGLRGGLEVSHEKLEALRDSGSLPSNAQPTVKKILTMLEQQIAMAEKFIEYLETGDAKHAKEYRKLRAKNWKVLGKFFGFDEKVIAALAPGGAELGLKKKGKK